MKKGTVSVVSALAGAVAGAAAGAGAVMKKAGESEGKMRELAEKHLALFLLMNQWVKVKQEGKDFASYFSKNGYKKIAIYGMSYVGETLIDELKPTDIEIVCGIDRNADAIYADVDVVTIDDELPEADAVIVTAITYFDEIEEKLSGKVSCPIISLEDILYEI